MKKKFLTIVLITSAFTTAFTSNIISEAHQTILKNQTREYGPRSQWVPSKAQTSKALEAIYKFLNQEISPDWRNRQRREIQDRISSYHVQFVGIIIDGRKVIHCNFFLEEDGFKREKNTYVLVLDGGTSYWRINYDMEKNKCFDFDVNGEA